MDSQACTGDTELVESKQQGLRFRIGTGVQNQLPYTTFIVIQPKVLFTQVILKRSLLYQKCSIKSTSGTDTQCFPSCIATQLQLMRVTNHSAG
jgi:hypothetical protein